MLVSGAQRPNNSGDIMQAFLMALPWAIGAAVLIWAVAETD